MTTIELPLGYINLEHTARVRAAINDGIVDGYAASMSEGAQFPPIMVFHDGNTYRLGDGEHRLRAAQQIGRTTILANVTPGGYQDAMWFALGANSTNGHRLTPADTKHAVIVALQHFPDKSASIIAAQIGCTKQYVADIRNEVSTPLHLPTRVTGVDGRSYAATSEQKRQAREKAVHMIREGQDVETVKAETGLGRDAIHAARREAGVVVDKSRAGVAARQAKIRTMADEGYSSRQMAAQLGVSEEHCRGVARRAGIEIRADKVMRGTHRHDPNRIMVGIVASAENLTAGADLIDFSALDRTEIHGWLRSLMASRDTLGGLIRRLAKEQPHVDVA